MALEGYTFDFMKVAPGMDAQLYHALNKGNSIIDGYLDEFKVTVSGLTVTVHTGAASVMGRFIRNTATLPVTVPANSNGFVVLTIDLTKNNTFTGTPGDDNYKPVNNQIRIERVASLTQQDLFNGGSIYHWPLMQYTSNGSMATISNAFTIEKMPKGVMEVLYRGSAGLNTPAKLSRSITRYRVIQVTTICAGNLTTSNFITNGDSSLSYGMPMHNLINDTSSKSWGLIECDVALKDTTATIYRTKEVNNSGGVSQPEVNIVSVLGIN